MVRSFRRVTLATLVARALWCGLGRSAPAVFLGAVSLASCAKGQPVNGTRVEDLFADPRARALAEAAGRGDAAEVARLVKSGVDPNSRGRDGVVPITWAMAKRNHAGMRALLTAGADPSAASAPGLKPLELAAGSDDPAMLRILLDAKGDPNARTSDGQPLLHVAVMQERPENLRLLVERGANVNATDESHTTAAQLAANISQWGLVALLLERGADPLIPETGGGTVANTLEEDGPPADREFRRAYDHVRQLLVTRGIKFPAETPEQVRLRVFGPNNPIDARIRRERAARGSQP